MNRFDMFRMYSFGYDNFGRWRDDMLAMHAKHPLDCPEFGAEWLRRWDAVGRLLEAPATIRIRSMFTNRLRTFKSAGVRSCAKQLATCIECGQRTPCVVRVVLLDGTIIREWWAK